VALGFVTKRVRRSVVTKVVDELSLRVADQTEQAIDLVARTRGPAIAAMVEVEQLRHPGLSPRELAELLTQQRMKVVAASGAISALPGAIPGAGSVTEIGASLIDGGWLAYNEVTLILAIAAAYGRDLRDEDARRLDVLLTIALEAGIAVEAGKRLTLLGEHVAVGEVPRDMVAAVNRRIGGDVVKRIARRRVKVILGRELPLGFGVAIGAGFNYVMMRRIGRAAIRYFEL
jgi:hypothetical protein